ncbi:MAG: L-aspartate oxidase [Proteiniphilum sp.]|jgi:L-aspartate oxidase|nr:L-aspartate oxidase [Proteiniphilum sp.]NCD14758.1 L-aspartate oxidase [Bacteroidia bacterium]HHT33591.1 L-aspartate oxidase [Bacteroidales bacterium]MDD2725820.1 L-aspartate oxidase [Proteiniphilum sp.]MDD3331786.1 L-aspartate oxidase [Proteiniphilum sp.]
MVHRYDFLVIGSGIAGMSYALKVAKEGTVAIVAKNPLEDANTYYAQGGIASVTNPWDNFEKHIADTLDAGGGLCDRRVVEKVVREAPAQIRELISWGVHFDRDETGNFDLHREGGHSENRILHHKDSTGAEIQVSLIDAIRRHPHIDVYDHHFAIEILTQHHLGQVVTRHTPGIECYGAYILDQQSNEIDTFLSRVTMMATGGIGSVYQTTTNPLVATGDGIAMVARAKGEIRGMEFVQFHPTALYHPGARPSFLITEAMRGYGGVLKTVDGREFMQKYDRRGSLAPRDIVARAIDSEMKERGEEHVYLDVTHMDAVETRRHFPGIYEKCLSYGIDITRDMIPVAPAAHYLCGGIRVDLDGCTSIGRLYANGECACTGLHGANRLASNSLIEAVVFADAAARHSLPLFRQYPYREDIPAWNAEGTSSPEEMVLITQSYREVGQLMASYVGIVRSDLRLRRAMDRLNILFRETEDFFHRSVVSREICELRNIIKVGYMVIKQAMARKESRGLHYTIDFPDPDPDSVL